MIIQMGDFVFGVMLVGLVVGIGVQLQVDVVLVLMIL